MDENTDPIYNDKGIPTNNITNIDVPTKINDISEHAKTLEVRIDGDGSDAENTATFFSVESTSILDQFSSATFSEDEDEDEHVFKFEEVFKFKDESEEDEDEDENEEEYDDDDDETEAEEEDKRRRFKGKDGMVEDESGKTDMESETDTMTISLLGVQEILAERLGCSQSYSVHEADDSIKINTTEYSFVSREESSIMSQLQDAMEDSKTSLGQLVGVVTFQPEEMSLVREQLALTTEGISQIFH